MTAIHDTVRVEGTTAPATGTAVPLIDDATRALRAAPLLAAARIAIGWTFLWAFLDKAVGLGFATQRADAWISGGSPTFGYLTFAT
jgi:thiosulfate dehydrogenase (quinone) large subunit